MIRHRCSRHPILRAIRPLAALPLAAALLAACGPEPGRSTAEAITASTASEASLALAGTPVVDGAATVECAMLEEPADGHGETLHTVRFGLSPAGGSPLRLEVTVPGYHGDGEYQAVVRLALHGEDGAYLESSGTGTASIRQGTRLASDTATDSISGSFRATYEGEAGSGEATGRVERCYYFE